jgi:hypothetical protein
MKLGSDHPMIETLAAVIAHSQIVVAHSPMPALPAGFEDLDIAMLDWIAVEGRRLGGAPPHPRRGKAHRRQHR